MEFFNAITINEAVDRLKEKTSALIKQTVEIDTFVGCGNIIAEDIFSPEALPPFSRSTVDGYAVRVTDTQGATEAVPSILKIVGKVIMGKPFKATVKQGEAVYVPTGGVLPDGADGVLMVEDTDVSEETLLARKSLHKNENVLREGDDIQDGCKLLSVGYKLTSAAIGALCGLGIKTIKVFKNLTAYIISTGDELRPYTEEDLPRGFIRDVNSPSLAALAINHGISIVDVARIKDDEEELKRQILLGLGCADIVLISGGSSVGTKDYTYDAINSLGGDVFIKGISIKPGKPTIAGIINGKPVIGLPGHPMAASIVTRALLFRAIDELRQIEIRPETFGTAALNFHSAPGKTTFQPVKTVYSDGEIKVYPVFGKSGAISPLVTADGYVIISDNAEGVEIGEKVAVYKLD